MLAITPLQPYHSSRSWPYSTHALLLADSPEELMAALMEADVSVTLDHSHLFAHAHVEREGHAKLLRWGVPVLAPGADDRHASQCQIEQPLTDWH